ncbi:hypothetical protein [Endothiovibrio diazotrophicus]
MQRIKSGRPVFAGSDVDRAGLMRSGKPPALTGLVAEHRGAKRRLVLSYHAD